MDTDATSLIPDLPVRSFKFKKTKETYERPVSKIHDISLSDSDIEIEFENRPNDLKHDTGNHLTTKKFPLKSFSNTSGSEISENRQSDHRIQKYSFHEISDNSDSDISTGNLRADQTDVFGRLSNKITCDSRGSQSSEFKHDDLKIPEVKIARKYSQLEEEGNGIKGAKKKKRSAEEIEQCRRQALLLKEKKEEEKCRLKEERELKKKQLEFEKQRKRALQEAQRTAKPGECLKRLTVILSPGVVKEKAGAVILEVLQRCEVKYDIQAQVHDNLITFWRQVTEVQEHLENNVKTKSLGLGDLEDLHDHVTKIKRSLEGRDVTLIIQGLEKYFRDQKTRENRAFKKGVEKQTETESCKRKKTREETIIRRLDVEEALIHLQLNDGCNIKFSECDQDTAKMVQQYAKAVAETPFKRDRLDTGFSFHLSSSGSAHVNKEGQGLINVWRQQLQQFSQVTAEVANAIVADYPSPNSLYTAYQACETPRQGEKLLENIQVRRGAGVMATTRRVGKELSRRVYQMFTTSQPDFVVL